MKFASCIFGGFALGLAVLAGLSYTMERAMAQTRADGTQQIKNLSPIVSVARSQCIGSGTNTVTNPDNSITTYTWNCAGLQLYKMTLLDGTVLGPYITIPATAAQAASANWQTLPLNSPDPAVPNSLGSAK